MLRKPFAGAVHLRTVCKRAVYAERAINGQNIHRIVSLCLAPFKKVRLVAPYRSRKTTVFVDAILGVARGSSRHKHCLIESGWLEKIRSAGDGNPDRNESHRRCPVPFRRRGRPGGLKGRRSVEGTDPCRLYAGGSNLIRGSGPDANV